MTESIEQDTPSLTPGQSSDDTELYLMCPKCFAECGINEEMEHADGCEDEGFC